VFVHPAIGAECHRFVMEKMCKAARGELGADCKMPTKAESYVAFLDLCFVVGAAKDQRGGQQDTEDEREEEEEGVRQQGIVATGIKSGRKWHTFGVKGFDVSKGQLKHVRAVSYTSYRHSAGVKKRAPLENGHVEHTPI
jgi:hypothetical protein